MSETEEYEYPRSRKYTAFENSEGERQFSIDSLDPEVVVAIRETATQFLKDNPDSLAMRTCWVCNEAHIHMIDTTDEYVLHCFACGRWYFKQTDITIYEETEDAE